MVITNIVAPIFIFIDCEHNILYNKQTGKVYFLNIALGASIEDISLLCEGLVVIRGLLRYIQLKQLKPPLLHAGRDIEN